MTADSHADTTGCHPGPSPDLDLRGLAPPREA
jgi:hypothetical protein